MKFFIIILRLVFFPIKIINNLIYGTPPPFIVGYSWYTQKDYGMMIHTAKDDPEFLIPTFEQWKQHAEVQVQGMRDKNWMVFRVRMKNHELSKWLKKNNLVNIVENREQYMNYRLTKFLNNPVI